ncbi:MAG: hypothetical protein K9H58_12375, partial [Bacteroidales bacterium]|nr:hypothetical protein [Bacteroidales bacterium]
MKTTLSIALIVLFSISGFSQKRAQVNKSMKYYSVQAEMSNPIDGSEIYQGTLAPVKSTNFQSEEDMGETFYDKQSNRAVANRVYLHPDGTMAATWTFSLETSGFNDRGSAYNYYDGNAWGSWPTARVETIRSGWPSYAPLGENGEIIVSHNAVDALVINARPEKGTGSWTETLLQGPAGFDKVTWPRVTTTGTDNSIVHVLGMIRDYPISGDMELAYYRSDDAAVSWEIENYLIPGTSHDDYNDLGADSYTFAEPRAGVIAFFVANIWCDAFIMKSTDDGDSWDKIMVWEHPYPFYDENTIFTDTLWAPDNSGHIALDSEGKAHVVFGLCFVNHAEVGTTYTYYPAYGDGIAYWNEDMDPFENANQHDALDPYDVLEEDVNLIGWSQDLDNSGTIDLLDPVIAYSEIGLSTMPNIIVDETNRIFVAWASTTESFDNGVNNYKHIWARASHSTDIGWGSFLDITGGLIHIFDECVYPQFAPLSDDNVYLMYNYDQNPGNAVD